MAAIPRSRGIAAPASPADERVGRLLVALRAEHLDVGRARIHHGGVGLGTPELPAEEPCPTDHQRDDQGTHPERHPRTTTRGPERDHAPP
jgi:hypothetical protein